jgi:hypothetical protein
MEAVQIRLLFVDDDRSAIMVNISVMITLLNDDGFVVAIPMITVSDDVTVAVSVTISVTLTNRYASTANTNPDFLRSSRHCAANANYGGDYYGILNHCVFLSLLNPGMPMSQRRHRSGSLGVRSLRSIVSAAQVLTWWSILLTFRNRPLPNSILASG